MSLYLRLAWRNIWRHRRRTLIVVLAIGLTLALMMLYDGVIAGFETAIYGNAIKVLGGNIQVHADGYGEQADQTPLLPLADDQAIVNAALKQPQVLAATRRINTGGLASSREGAFPVSIIGIEPEVELPVSLLAQNVVAGRYLEPEDQDMIFIGQGLASAMGVAVGDRITLVGRSDHDQMRQRTMTVVGIYDVGMPDIEKRTVYMSLAEAQSLYGLRGKATEVAMSLEKLGQEPAVIGAIQPALPGYEIASWETNFPELQAAIQTKGGVMNVFSVIILIIAGIGILNLLLMAVYERTREIGILGALGLKPRQISLLFLLEGALMGLVGVAFGVGLGLLVNGIFAQDRFRLQPVCQPDRVHCADQRAHLSDPGAGTHLAAYPDCLIISVLAAFYPAREAAQNEPAEALHFV